MFKIYLTCVATLIFGCLATSPAHAHFTLLKPASWLQEDAQGCPQKAGPCGPGGYDQLIGQCSEVHSGAITTFHAGETIDAQWMITVPHDGYFRISIAETAAKDAKMTDFPDPPFIDSTACSLDLASVAKGPHDNVLMDGIVAGSTMQTIKLPDKPCDACTLQVIQVMKDHGPPNCIYYHCADLKILPAGSTGAAGAGTSGTGASGSGAAGASTSGSAGAGAGGTGSGSAGRVAGGGGVGSGGVSGVVTKPAVGGASGAVTGTAGVTGTTGTGPGVVPTAGAAGTTAPVAPAPTAKTSGCAVVQPGASSGIAGWFALGLGALFLRRRKRGA
jgi:MYXO-CTERM domain-containing protein